MLPNSTADGFPSRTRGQERISPSGPRVLQMASELRKRDWGGTQMYVRSTGDGFPVNEKRPTACFATFPTLSMVVIIGS